jgi:hypothetical protein
MMVFPSSKGLELKKMSGSMVLKKVMGYLFSKVRYSKINDPFKEFEQLQKESKMSDLRNEDKVLKGNILVLPIRVSPTSNLFEGLLGYALSLRGYKVSSLLDGGCLNISENNSIGSNSFVGTALSVYEQSRFCRIFNQQPIYFQELIELDELKLVKSSLEPLNFNELNSYAFKGIQVGIHAKFGLMRYLKRETIDETHRNLLIKFVITAVKCVLATESAIKNVKPQHAIISHGCYSTWGTALEVLNKHKIHTVVWGRGYVSGGNILLSHNDSYLYEYIHEPNKYWNKEALGSSKIEQVLNYYNQKRIPKNKVDGISYYKKSPNEHELRQLRSKISDFDSCIGIYPNIPWDGTMFSGTDGFPSIRHFVESLYPYIINNPKVHFIVRCHPAEVNNSGNEADETFLDIFNQVFLTSLDNVTIIPPDGSINSYEVSTMCNAAIMFGSTLSLEFSIANHPVIQVGQTNTTNKGFVFDAPTKELFYKYLDDAVNGKLELTESQLGLAIKYAHHWVFRRHIPESLVELDGMKFKKYKFSSINELEAGNNPTLDFICDSIIQQKPFVFPSN